MQQGVKVLERLHLEPEAASPQQKFQIIGKLASMLRRGRLSVPQICQQCALAASVLLGGRGCELWLCAEQVPQLQLVAASSFPADYTEQRDTLPLDLRSIQGRAMLYQDAVFITDSICLPTADQQRLQLVGARSVAALPLVINRQALGVLCALDKQPHSWSLQERTELGLLADLAAMALHNVQLAEHEESMRRYEENLVAAVSHELRTPLTSILGYLSLFQRRLSADMDITADGPKVQHYLQVAMRQAHVLSNIIDELLDVAMIQNEQLVLHPEPVQPVALLNDVLRDIREQYSERTIHVEAQEPLPQQANWDAARVRQILRHLLKNAIVYSPAESPVDIKLDYTPSDVQITIRDHGTGIQPLHQDRIFKRFWRGVDNSFRKSIYGLGVGLYVSQALAAAHGGHLRVESSGVPGQGSLFILELPWQSPTLTALVKGALG